MGYITWLYIFPWHTELGYHIKGERSLKFEWAHMIWILTKLSSPLWRWLFPALCFATQSQHIFFLSHVTCAKQVRVTEWCWDCGRGEGRKWTRGTQRHHGLDNLVLVQGHQITPENASIAYESLERCALGWRSIVQSSVHGLKRSAASPHRP